MKKALSLVLALMMMLALVACGGGDAPASEAPAEESAAPAEDGGEEAPEGEEAPAGDSDVSIVMISQAKGNEYFIAANLGAEKAAAELGIDFVYDGPSTGRVDLQIEMINTYMSSGVDAMCVATVDSTTIAPAIQAAMDAGIKVITYDVDADARDFFVNPADPKLYAQTLIDTMVKDAGSEEFEYVLLCEHLTDVMQSMYMEYAEEYAKEAYPGLTMLELKQCGQSQEDAYTITKDLMKVYPDVKGFASVGTIIFPGIIEAVKDAGKTGEIAVEGMGTPNEVRSYLEEESINNVVLWNVEDLGYAAVYAAYNAVTGSLNDGDTATECGNLGELQIVTETNEIMVGDAYIFTRENVNDFDW